MNTILEQINSAGNAFVEFALPMLAQSSVLIVILLLADLLLRKKVKAVFRYWIWMLVLAKLVLPTSLSSPLSLGYWFGDKLMYVTGSEMGVETEAEAVEPAPTDMLPIINIVPIEVGRHTPAVLPMIPGAELVVAEPVSPPAASVTPLSWQGIVFLIWLAVVIAMGLLLLQRALFVRGLVAQAKEANRLMNDALVYCCERMGVKRKLGLKVSANATSPAVCGLIRPMILLPRNLLSSLGAGRLRAVLMHELAHIKRGDLWVNLVQTVLQIIYFYNPLLWLANCVIRRVREQAVDEAVLVAMGEKARQYPQTLVDVAKLAFKQPALSLRLIGVVESKSALAGRIKHILGRPMPKSAKIGIVGVLAVVIVGSVLLPMAKGEREKDIRNPVSLDENGKPIVTHTLYMWGQKEEPVYQLEGKTYRDVGKVVARIGELMKQDPFPYIRVRTTKEFQRQQEPIENLSERCRSIGFINMEFKYDLLIPPGTYQATLPNGVTVELVGLYYGKDLTDLKFWKPNGSVMSDSESKTYRKRAKFPEWRNKKFEFEYGLMVRFSQVGDLHTDVFVKQGQRMSYRHSKTEEIAVALVASDWNDRKEGFLKVGNIKVATACGPWSTHKSSARITEPAVRYLDNSSMIMYSPPRKTDEWLVDITINADNIDLDCFYELKDGSVHHAVRRGTIGHPNWIGPDQRTPMSSRQYALFHEPENIKNYIIKYRKFEIVEFKNVSLRPGVKTDVQVEVGSSAKTRLLSAKERAETDRWVSITGSVKNAGWYLFDPNAPLRLSELVTAAGYNAEEAGTTCLDIQRQLEKDGETAQVLMHRNLQAVLLGVESAPVLERHDAVMVYKIEPSPKKDHRFERKFGPIVELVVNGGRTKRNIFVDFDSEKLLSLPDDLDRRPKDECKDWMRKRGIDAWSRMAPEIAGLVGFDMVALSVDNHYWGLEADTVADRLAIKSIDSPILIRVEAGLPATYLIKTREHGLGVLQILAFTKDPEGVRIRYKLLDKGETKRTDVQVEVVKERMARASEQVQAIDKVLRGWFDGCVTGDVSLMKEAYPSPDHPMIEDHLHDMKELLGLNPGWRFSLLAIMWDESEAMAVSESLKHGDPKVGEPMILVWGLKKTEGRWLLSDIDLEELEGLQIENSRFLQKHPNAQVWFDNPDFRLDKPDRSGTKLQPGAKTDVQVERIEPRALDISKTVTGIATDKLGRLRGNVYIAPQSTSIWKGIRSDTQGRFTLEDVTPEQKKWVAYSQPSQAMGLFTIPENYTGQPIHVILNFREAEVEGRVVDPDGKGLADRKVELITNTKQGVSYYSECYRKTDKYGNYSSNIPCGSSLTVQAKLADANESEQKYVTEAITLSDNQIFVAMPRLVIGEGQPEQTDDGKVLYSGRVVNEQGDPIQGVEVQMMYKWRGSMGVWGKKVMTDEQGRWKRRLPKDLSNLRIGLLHPEYIEQSGYRASSAELLNGTNVMVMKQGLWLRGVVKNQQGEPIENALVDTGGGEGTTPYGEVIENCTTPRTLADGSFSIGGLAAGSKDIVVSAVGYAPRVVSVEVEDGMEPIEVSLKSGTTYVGQVVDVDGNPVERVKIDVGDWRVGKRRSSITRMTETDSQGLFKIEDLPEEGKLRFDFGKRGSGFQGFSKEMPEDLSHRDKIVMYKTPVFVGKVIDAETEEPVTSFKIVNGVKWKSIDESFHWSRYRKRQVNSEDGTFTETWSGYHITYPFDGASCLKIEAKGYLPEITPPIKLGGKYEPFVIRLTKAEPWEGIVVDREGRPAVKAEVGWVGPDKKAFIKNGRFDATGWVAQAEVIVETNENGQFELNPTREEGLMVVVHSDGYAHVKSNDFKSGSRIQLIPWAKIEGTIASADTKSREFVVAVNPIISSEDYESQPIKWLFDRTSFSDKHFIIDYVPSIPLQVGQIVRWEQSNPVYIKPQPGEAYKVQIGGRGRTITGKIIHPIPERARETGEAGMSNPRRLHAAAYCIEPESKLPDEIRDMSERSFLWLWRDATNVYERSKTFDRRFIANIEDNGTFRFDNMPPGEYEFVVNYHAPLGESVSCGRGVLEAVAITGFKVDTDDTRPIHLPDIRMSLLTYPEVGDPASLFEARSLDGKVIRLEDFRGKVVLLDFWATWCRPCLDQMPKLKKIYEAFAANPRFAMIGMSVDWDLDKAKRFVADNGLQWPHACLGDMSESLIVKQYGVGAIPTAILIGGDGKIIAGDLRAEEIKSAVAKALGTGSASNKRPDVQVEVEGALIREKKVYETYFPENQEEGEKLDKLFEIWNEKGVDSKDLGKSDKDILRVVRSGFRRTQKHRTLILRLVGNRYIWGNSPQNEDALDLMYQASFSPDSNVRHYAYYFGLSVINNKKPKILERLAQLCIHYKETDIGRIFWGVRSSNQADEFLSMLQLYLNSSNPEIRKRAETVIKEFTSKADVQVEGEQRKPPVWIALLPRSPIRSAKELYLYFWGNLLIPGRVKIDSFELEIRSAKDNIRMARINCKSMIIVHTGKGEVLRWSMFRDGLRENMIRRIGPLEDGEYLIAIYVNGIRCSNVARFTVDSGFDGSDEPTLQVVPLVPAPGQKLQYFGLRAIGPAPQDPKFTNYTLHFPDLIVDGELRKRPEGPWSGPVYPIKPGQQHEEILLLKYYNKPAIDLSRRHTIKAIVGKYESAPVEIGFDHSIGLAWDKATATIRSRPPQRPVLEGRVIGPDGKPGVGYKVCLYAGPRSQFIEYSDKDGKYDFPNVPPGKYMLICQPKGKSEPALEFEQFHIKADETKVEELSFQGKYTFSGNVTYEDGSPAGGVRIVGRWEISNGKTVFRDLKVTDANGYYKLTAPFELAEYISLSIFTPDGVPGQGSYEHMRVRGYRTDVDFVVKRKETCAEIWPKKFARMGGKHPDFQPVPVPEGWDHLRILQALHKHLEKQGKAKLYSCRATLKDNVIQLSFNTRKYNIIRPGNAKRTGMQRNNDRGIGPEPDGLILTVHLSKTAGQFVRPHIIDRSPWTGFISQVYLSDIKLYLNVDIQYGTRINKKLLTDMCAPTCWLKAIFSAAKVNGLDKVSQINSFIKDSLNITKTGVSERKAYMKLVELGATPYQTKSGRG